MIHLRGHKKDFDNWGKITGDPQWSWEGVLPFFKSYEDYEIPGDNGDHIMSTFKFNIKNLTS